VAANISFLKIEVSELELLGIFI